jgi:hypothetical protein
MGGQRYLQPFGLNHSGGQEGQVGPPGMPVMEAPLRFAVTYHETPIILAIHCADRPFRT